MKGHLCKWGEQCHELKTWHSIMQRRVRVLDNGGRTVDRYTVLVSRTEQGAKVWDVYTMSENAGSPQGVNMYSHTIHDDERKGFYDGRRIGGVRVQVQSLPAEVITAIEHRI